jgi:hypothetical protein
MRTPTDQEIDQVCMTFRHDFGLLPIVEANKVRQDARRWFDAWRIFLSDEMPDQIDLYRIIKSSGARRHSDIAKAVADALE